MPVEQLMGMAIAHYYSTRDPFGRVGDFITAPEISQMFGEMIGVFMADAWMGMGAPERIALVEFGPGRGTLMADLLRGTKNIPGFHAALSVHLVEISPELRGRQKKCLEGYDVTWHDRAGTLPDGVPLFVVGNEFLDALPVRQYIWKDGAWALRCVGLGAGDKLQFGAIPAIEAPDVTGQKEGDVFETSPVREAFVDDIARRIAVQGGVAVLIDYGNDDSGFGDTLQAIKAHQFVPVLEGVGEADLTSHVDFGRLKAVARAHCAVRGPMAQGDFLRAMGIELRAARLNQEAEMRRLCDAEQMGQLFRVMILGGGGGSVL
jgi:NADH dehydrogenase [ubiquinone] 1 alpha subcomplex assembly factor 7